MYVPHRHLLVLIAAAGCSNDVQIAGTSNVAPTVAITAPPDQTVTGETDSIEFLGTVADGNGLDDLLSVVWTSNVDGELGSPTPDSQGIVRLSTTLSAGTHTVTLQATDAGGLSASDSISVIVEGVTHAPLVEITSPGNLAQFELGEDVTFVGGVDDLQQPASELLVLWSHEDSSGGVPVELFSGSPSSTGSTSATWTQPPVGSHRIVLEATDEDGNVGRDEIVIDVVDPGASDGDQDGIPASTDCDDTDPFVYPGAPEECDGVDNDCDNIIDEKDVDVDGHIDELCVAYNGPLPADDCDDLDDDVHPGAAELDDLVDNDCDGEIDEGTDSFDDDGDCACEGVTCNGSAEPACAGVLVTGDCDDSNPDANPHDLDLDGVSSCDGDCDDSDATLTPIDGDGDGYSSCDGDCDDTDAGLHLDDLDLDGWTTCEGDCDDSSKSLNLNDADYDGYTSCDDDCNDLNNAVSPADADGDGYSTCDGDCDDADASAIPLDGDGDGLSSCGGDCDDADASLNQDDADADGFSTCDGDCDDSSATLSLADLDGDGFSTCAGDCNNLDSTLNPADADADGFSTCALDCDDSDAALNLSDLDGDGQDTCSGDCDDAEATIWLGAPEVIGDGIDQDCDLGDTCYTDADLDGQGVPTPVGSTDLDCVDPGESLDTDDCDDTDATIYGGAPETVADGIDQDCNGLDRCYEDADGDGAGTPTVIDGADLTCDGPGESTTDDDCDDADAGRFPGNGEVVADGIDQDCDDVDSCYMDADWDGWGSVVVVVGEDLTCTTNGEAPIVGDCNDIDAGINPDATEAVATGVDEDCDGSELCYEDLDGDAFGTPTIFVGDALDCDVATNGAKNDTDCDDANAGRFPGNPEVIGDDIDQDCNGVDRCWTDADNDEWGVAPDLDAAGATCGTNEAKVSGDCDDADSTLTPADNDGDGFSTCTGDCDDADFYADPADIDGDGLSTCDGDCDDVDAATYPGALDLPDDTYADTDCDGIDGAEIDGAFVSSTGFNGLLCTKATPCKTINHALAYAESFGKAYVYVQDGIYAETVELIDGIDLIGGYDTSWTRDSYIFPGHVSEITGAAWGATPQYIGVYAADLVIGVTLDNMVVTGPDAVGDVTGALIGTRSGLSSYAIYAKNAVLTVHASEIRGGSGAPGGAGAAGASATQVAAEAGDPGLDSEESWEYCSTSRQAGGAAGYNLCGGVTLTSGGDGGSSGSKDTDCTLWSEDWSARGGLNGSDGSGPVPGNNGVGGGVQANGTAGTAGGVVNGIAGAGASYDGKLGVFDAFWYAKDAGGGGALGDHGAGGGGGGGGGGSDVGTADETGGGGGGGGAGGCKATTGGEGGGGGGSSFGIFGYTATIEVTDTVFLLGTGGNGGKGGDGGAGQPGGAGGLGGTKSTDGGDGGAGGAGSHGGHSGAGGGGAGGGSYGIYTYASTVTQTATAFSGGAAGAGGAGGAKPSGWADGNAGTAGAAGIKANTATCASTSDC